MIKSFRDKRTEELFVTGNAPGVPPDVLTRALRKLDLIDDAAGTEDFRKSRGNRFHSLKGDRLGQHSIAVNDQWRICFRFIGGHAYDVEFCDYH
ncbi:MAG: type II toxin-antitoxin system RelE/ParE family toxin [Gemmatimonadaceae bacterium]